MSEDLPTWARRIRTMREARDWSQPEAVERMRSHSKDELPESTHMLRRWKAWERGENKPGSFYASVIASTLGTVTASLFPPAEKTNNDVELLNATGMDTLEIVGRLQSSDVNEATLEAVRITVDKICTDYSRLPAQSLILEGRQWLRRLVEMQEQRLSFSQRRDTLELAGWLTLLVGCLEFDLGDQRSAEATRRSALSLGQEIGSPGIIGWAHEMRAWFALTNGDYRGVVSATDAGETAAGNHSVGVQIIAQQAKALARMGRRDEMLNALERGRTLLDSMSYPDNVQNHFVVDPTKFDFYAMDCYRHIGENRLARELSDEVIRVSTDFNGTQRWPMRVAEAQITLGVVAAREGDLDEAISYGQRAISGERKSLPSLALVATDLGNVLSKNYSGNSDAHDYLEQLRSIQGSS